MESLERVKRMELEMFAKQHNVVWRKKEQILYPA
jgi:hypothetical protein